LVVNLQPPEWWHSKLLLLRLPRLWCFVPQVIMQMILVPWNADEFCWVDTVNCWSVDGYWPARCSFACRFIHFNIVHSNVCVILNSPSN
jgi:hypothetical protein